MFLKDLFAFTMILGLNGAFFFTLLLIHGDLTFFNLLGLLVTYLLIAIELQLVYTLLILQLKPLLQLFFHIFDDKRTVQLNLPKLILSVNRKFFSFSLELLGCRCANYLAVLIILNLVFVPYLIELDLLLLQLHFELVLNLNQLSFLVFLEHPSLVLDIS
jgi:hypothetical protein